MSRFSRRAVLLGGSAVLMGSGLGGCVGAGVPTRTARAIGPAPVFEPPEEAPFEGEVGGIYGRVEGERFPVPPAPLSRINPAFLRRRVPYDGSEPPGTIVVDPGRRYLYLTLERGQAMRYGVGVGREGFAWNGAATINSKQEWPDWYPPKEMIQRQPEIRKELAALQGGQGVPGGPRNPLGARALYLWQNGKDTLYRIHGTLEPWTVGSNVSSGCIRMINQDAIDLYGRVPTGTKVVVLSSGAEPVARAGARQLL